MLEPITARPVTPIWAVPTEFSDELMEAFRLGWRTRSLDFGRSCAGEPLSGEQPLEFGEPRYCQGDGRQDEHSGSSEVSRRRKRQTVGPPAEPTHAQHGGWAARGQRTRGRV